MSTSQKLRQFASQRLAAAVEEILGVFDKTVIEYEEELERHRRLLAVACKPDVKLHRIELQQQPVHTQTKGPTEQQPWKLERISSLDSQDSEPPTIIEQYCCSQNGEQLGVKQETDSITFISTCIKSYNSGSLDLSHGDTWNPAEDLHVANTSAKTSVEPESRESQEHRGANCDNSGSNRNTEPNSNQEINKNEKKNMHNPSQLQMNSDRHPSKPKKPFKCNTCGKAFRYMSILRNHVRIHTGERPFSCDTCGKRFSDPSTLRSHLRIHTGKTPFPCGICGKKLSEEKNLRAHMRIHTGEKPYTCNSCGRGFCHLSVMRRHAMIHTGEKPHSCNICGRQYRRRTEMKKHMMTHTELPEHICEQEEGLTEQQNSSLHSEQQEHPQLKEEPCSTQEEDNLQLKQEIDSFILISNHVGGHGNEGQSVHSGLGETLSEEQPVVNEQLLLHSCESQDRNSGRHVLSASHQDAEQKHSCNNKLHNSTLLEMVSNTNAPKSEELPRWYLGEKIKRAENTERAHEDPHR